MQSINEIKKLFDKILGFNSRQTSIPEFLKQYAHLSGDYTKSGEIVTNKWTKQKRIIHILFMTIYGIKLIASLLLPEDSVWLYYIGDTGVILEEESSKTYLISMHLALTINALFNFLYFWRNESPELMLWLRPTLVLNGKKIKNIFHYFN